MVFIPFRVGWQQRIGLPVYHTTKCLVYVLTNCSNIETKRLQPNPSDSRFRFVRRNSILKLWLKQTIMLSYDFCSKLQHFPYLSERDPILSLVTTSRPTSYTAYEKVMTAWMNFGSKLLSSLSMSGIYSFHKYLRYRHTC